MLASLAQRDVHRTLAHDKAGGFVAERAQVQVAKERLAFSEHDRAHREDELVDEARLEILPDRRDAAAEPHVASARRGFRLLERGVDAFGDEMEGGPALHRN